MRRRVALIALVIGGVACKRDAAPRSDSAAPVAAASNATAATTATVACPVTGHWNECQLRKRLDQSGLAPQSMTEKAGDLPALEGTPINVRLGNATIAVYLYPDSMARHRAAATLDTAKFISQSRPVSMQKETTLIVNDNALALLFSQNEHQRERVSDAITAGPPQP